MSFNYYYVGFPILIAALISLVLWRRQRKYRISIGGARMTIVYVVAALTCILCMFALDLAVRQSGLDSGKWTLQAMQLAATLIAYLVAGKVLARLQKRAAA